jgi:hypothetical protein
MKEATDKLMEIMSPISTRLYQASNPDITQPSAEDIEKMKSDPRFAEMFNSMTNGQATQPNTNKSSDDIIDAEVL